MPLLTKSLIICALCYCLASSRSHGTAEAKISFWVEGLPVEVGTRKAVEVPKPHFAENDSSLKDTIWFPSMIRTLSSLGVSTGPT